MDMKFAQNVGLVTGGASGLGLATAKRLQRKGMRVVIVDLPTSKGKEVARDLGDNARFVAADVADAAQMSAAFDAAQDLGTLRALVHCAGRGGAVRLVDRDGNPGSLETFEAVIRTNLVGTFNTLRLAAARMARNEPEDGDGGVCVLTARLRIRRADRAGAVASPRPASSHTLVAHRELAGQGHPGLHDRPGIFDTPCASCRRRLASLGNPCRPGAARDFR